MKITIFALTIVLILHLKGAPNDFQNEHQKSPKSTSKWPQKATLRHARLYCKFQWLFEKRLKIETLRSRLNSLQKRIKKATKNQRFLYRKRSLPSNQKVDFLLEGCTKIKQRGASKKRSKNSPKMHQKCTPKYIKISENMISEDSQKWRICNKTQWKSLLFVCRNYIQNDTKMVPKWRPNAPQKGTKMS